MSWTEKVDVTLAARELNSLRLKLPNDQSADYEILHIFPFTSERKRMGIIVKVGTTFLLEGGTEAIFCIYPMIIVTHFHLVR